MVIEKLQFSNIRNLKEGAILPSPSINFIVGSNGSGKSSLIEALSLITSARSFRTKKSSRIVNRDHSGFTLFAKMVSGLSNYSVGLQRDNNLDHYKIRVNRETINRASVLASYFPQLTISPEQCDLIDGPPEKRRSFIDWSLFHVKHDYNELISNYRKSLAQRNRLLRNRDGAKLDHWDTVLCSYAETIDNYRSELFSQILEILKRDISGRFKVELELDKLQIDYHAGWKKGVTLLSALNDSRGQDMERGFTHQGPHRADFRITLDSVPIRELLSRGEKKLLQILLTVAQLIHFRVNTETDPVILMDDIFAELDNQNVELLFELVRELGLQLFVTATDLVDVTKFLMDGEKLFHVKQGLVTEMLQ
ncbi:MAG: DNA replication and repair protein RecF [Gammaproteobacteria bacterium]|nr:DNA replication and repair protein RecF [Gammaproteobacteria bacterium]